MYKIIATSPIVDLGEGYAATRIVLRQYKGEYVVHKQRFYEDGTTAFDHGNYFMVHDDDVVPLLKAWTCFASRSHELLADSQLVDLKSDPVRFATILEQGGGRS